MIAPQSPPPARGLPTFEAIYRRHQRDVARYLALMLGDPDEAQELTAEAFRRGLEAWRDGRGPAGNSLPWLLTIARRLALNRWRRRRLLRWTSLSRIDHQIRAAGTTDETDFWMWLDALSREIPERQREVLFLRYRRDLRDDEIGEVMGLSASGVRSLVARAIESLRQHPELLR